MYRKTIYAAVAVLALGGAALSPMSAMAQATPNQAQAAEAENAENALEHVGPSTSLAYAPVPRRRSS